MVRFSVHSDSPQIFPELISVNPVPADFVPTEYPCLPMVLVVLSDDIISNVIADSNIPANDLTAPDVSHVTFLFKSSTQKDVE